MRARFLVVGLGCALTGCDFFSPGSILECSISQPGVYSPYGKPQSYPFGPVSDLPWNGPGEQYPAGNEDFRQYETGSLIECTNEKSLRSHLDVTDGCLRAELMSSTQNSAGKVEPTAEGYFRAVALGYATGGVAPVQWSDGQVEYSFLYSGAKIGSGDPGFKTFARYMSEDDLYVASWRFDGVVQIQAKLCGEYQVLARHTDYPPPSVNVWHRMRFVAAGSDLSLWLDDQMVLAVSDSALPGGTFGIRIDSADQAFIDDWKVAGP